MKIHILYTFHKSPYGGGNQFLHALKKELLRIDSYAETTGEADTIIINVNPGMIGKLIHRLPQIRRSFPQKPLVFRIDGPVYLVRGKGKMLDYITMNMIALYADGIIFQSEWSKYKNNTFGISSHNEFVIQNAPDREIFYRPTASSRNRKVRLIASSWSANLRKGFDIYSYLDTHLDFGTYSMTFAGNSPYRFHNIAVIEPLPSAKIAKLLRRHDIYITASLNDPCSNSLLEAISCGLPAVARRSGGHPEIVKGGGVLFDNKYDVIPAIHTISTNWSMYNSMLPDYSIQKTARQYLACAHAVLKRHQTMYAPQRTRQFIMSASYHMYNVSNAFRKYL